MENRTGPCATFGFFRNAVTAWEMGRLLAPPEGVHLVSTIKRLVSSQGLPAGEVIKQSAEHLERLETLARRTGRSVKEVAEEALALYKKEHAP